MVDIMLDIETLGQGPGCIITSIAMVPFHLNGKALDAGDVDPFIMYLNVGEQLALGYKMNEETLNWWMQKDPSVRYKTFTGIQGLQELCVALPNFMWKVCDLYKNYRIWSTSAKMDFGCIHYTFTEEDAPYPFDHRAEHCARTVRNLTKMLIPNYKLDADKNRNHDALQDCRAQISQLQEQYQLLRGLVKGDYLIDEASKAGQACE